MFKKVVQIIVVSLGILFLIFGTPRYQSIKIKNDNIESFEYKLKEEVNSNFKVDIKKLVDFDWDECYVFTPYYPTELIYENVGTEWTVAKTYIEFLLLHNSENKTVSDDQYVIAFKKDGKVILAEKYSLNKLPIIFKLDDYKFKRDNAQFIVTDANQYNEGKVKELVLRK
jgi:hypothetical protein